MWLLTVPTGNPTAPDVDGSAMSAAMWLGVVVFVVLVVGCALIAVRIVRRTRERSAEMAAWTRRVTATPVRLADDDTREIRVPSGPRHRARNERPMTTRMSNAAGRFAATVAQARGRR